MRRVGSHLREDRRSRDLLDSAILAYQPNAYWPMDDSAGPLHDISGSSALVTLATSADADDIVDTTSVHGLAAGDQITFVGTLTGGSNVVVGTTYFVIAANLAAQTFQFSATAGGSAFNFGSDITVGTVQTPRKLYPATVTGTPTYGVTAPDPITRGIAWSGSGQFATTATSIPNPTTSMSFLSIFSLTDATASVRNLAGRGTAGQFQWKFALTTTHTVDFTPFQLNNVAHCTVSAAGAVNDGRIRLAVGTFDGTTGRLYVAANSSLVEASSTTLAGSWGIPSTAGIFIAATNSGSLFPGVIYRSAYWRDRVLSGADVRYLASVAFGG